MSSIHFRETGSGHPIVFLHGFCDTHELWDGFTDSLAENFHVLAPDLPGFGKSDRLTAPFSIDQVADAIAGWARANSLDRFIVVGHSLGGYVALALLQRHPALLTGLVLFHSTPYPDSEERKKIRNKVIEFVKENGVAPFIETFVPGLFADKKHAAITATRVRCLQTESGSLVGYAVAMRERPDRSEVMRNATVPVMVMGGVKDSLIPFDDLRKLAEKTPKIRLFELAETGHMGMFEAKNQAQSILSRFVREIWPIKGT